MDKKTIEDIELNGKKVIVRVDFNVPLDDNLNVTDDTRIVAALPTIQYLQNQNAKIILMSHLGRPKGQVVESMRLTPVAKRLSELLNQDIKTVSDCIGSEVKTAAENLNEKEILLLENLRFYAEEEKNDDSFAKELSSLAEIYVNDAFGTAHRAHASTEGVAHHLPAVSGYLMKKELDYLGKALMTPEKPFVAIVGGAKVSTKITVLEHLLDKVDTLIIGGAMTYTFCKADGWNIGTSLCEDEFMDTAKTLVEKAKEKNVEIVIPVDHVIADEFKNDARIKTVVGDIPDGFMGMDVGPKTIELITMKLKEAKTVLWNGPLGVFEMENYSKGTFSVANTLAEIDAITVIGGGDSVSAVNKSGLADKMSHISTGGGASIEFIEGKKLPGIEALLDK